MTKRQDMNEQLNLQTNNMHISFTQPLLFILSIFSILSGIFCDLDRHFRFVWDKKIPHDYLKRYAHVICTLEAFGGDLKTNKIPSEFVNAVGPNLGREEVLRNAESFREFYCTSTERKFNSSYLKFIIKFYRENSTIPEAVINKCRDVRSTYNRMMYEEICTKKNPIARQTETMAAGCYKEAQVTPNCTQPLRQVANDASYILEYICSASDASNIVKYDESAKCLGGESNELMSNCIDKMIQTIDSQ